MAVEVTLPNKKTVVRTPISVTSYEEVHQAILARSSTEALAIACCNVHSVMSAARDQALQRALCAAQIATPDGMPLVWALRAIHDEPILSRVYGPDLMLHVLDRGRERDLRHYFLGSTESTLSKLRSNVEARMPGVNICGVGSPPFRPLSDEEVRKIAERVLTEATDVLWLGLGMPKQELLMNRLSSHLPGVALVGVGAAFDFIAGKVPQAPRWLQEMGGEWAFRLWQEPRRLYRRYIFNNPAYLIWLAYAWGRKQMHPRGKKEQ